SGFFVLETLDAQTLRVLRLADLYIRRIDLMSMETRRNGRPPLAPGLKRKSVVMLRLNDLEKAKLKQLKNQAGWKGGMASFVREAVLGFEAPRADIEINYLEEVLSVVATSLEEMEDHLPEKYEQMMAPLRVLLNEVAAVIFK